MVSELNNIVLIEKAFHIFNNLSSPSLLFFNCEQVADWYIAFL